MQIDFRKSGSKGMTLIELLVAILIAGILITIAWQGFSYCHKGYLHKKKLNEELQDQFLFEVKLRKKLEGRLGCRCQLGELFYESDSLGVQNFSDSVRAWFPRLDSTEFECPIGHRDIIISKTLVNKRIYKFALNCVWN